MDAVRATGLIKRYGVAPNEVRALDDVSLSLDPGTLTALLGPSGSGKSTLVKILGLVAMPDAGSVSFDGRIVVNEGTCVADVGELRRKHLGFVFQKSNLVSFLTARQNVELACELGGRFDPQTRTTELLSELGVLHRADGYPEMLSGGEQQRVAIARAIANQPSLVLADEPTAALDSVRGRAVMELFRTVAHEHGAAVLVVTHDTRALDVFDARIEMEDGRLSPSGRQAVAS